MKQFDRAALAQILNEGIAALGLELSADQTEKLLDYLALLAKWNSVYNLTSVRDPLQMLTLHVLDSLAAVPAFEGAVDEAVAAVRVEHRDDGRDQLGHRAQRGGLAQQRALGGQHLEGQVRKVQHPAGLNGGRPFGATGHAPVRQVQFNDG